MDISLDEIAGILQLFGGLTRSELEQAMSEVAFRLDESTPPSSWLDDRLATAQTRGIIVRDESKDPALYVPGPAAFPTAPTGSEDLPHILDIDSRSIDREAIAAQLQDEITDEVDPSTADERISTLIDLSYDIETWAGVDAEALRSTLDSCRE